jgi:hypothetical protein
VKVKAPASVLRLTQRWQDSALSALISTTRPSVTSKQAMPMLPLQHKTDALHCNWKVPFRAWRKAPSQQMEGALQGMEKGPFTATGRCPSGRGERPLHSKWKLPFRAWRKGPSQQMKGTNGIACTVPVRQKTVYHGQHTRGRSSLFPSAACRSESTRQHSIPTAVSL